LISFILLLGGFILSNNALAQYLDLQRFVLQDIAILTLMHRDYKVPMQKVNGLRGSKFSKPHQPR
jgi:hypothetical protein